MGRTPASSDHPSRPSFDPDKARVQDLIDAAKSNHEKAKIAVSQFCSGLERVIFVELPHFST